MVVVKFPELEKIATEPLRKDSSGLSPPSAPPMRTWFQASATPRQFGPNISTLRCCASARISRASCTGTFSVRMTIFSISPVDADQLEHAVAHRGRRQVDHADIELVSVVEALADVVIDGDRADRRLQHFAAASRRCAEHDVAARIRMADRRDAARLVAEDIQHANPVLAGGQFGQRIDADKILELLDFWIAHRNPQRPCSHGAVIGKWLCLPGQPAKPSFLASISRPPFFIQRSAAWA